MLESGEHTFTKYLGKEFQNGLMWQLLVDSEFAERVIPNIYPDYFDDPYLKKLIIIVLDHYKEYGAVPMLANNTIDIAINKRQSPSATIETEAIFEVLRRIRLYDETILNKGIVNSSPVIQNETTGFIKQQEYRKLAEYITEKVKTGEIRKKEMLGSVEEKINGISRIGDGEDMGTDVIDGVEFALRKEFRETIATGVKVIDGVTGGGLGKGEIGLILTPSGIGKTTALTKIANTAYDLGKNVLQIIFEDTEDQIKRKHYTIWSGVALSEIDDNPKIVADLVNKKISTIKSGRLIIKKFSQEKTTMIDLRNWISIYEKKMGFKFNLITLDYLDCVVSHIRGYDKNEDELVIVKSFLALASDLNIPCWSALQAGRGSFAKDVVGVGDMGGSIKRYQKAHFFMSIAKPADKKDGVLVNVDILKARFAKDGQSFKDSTFDNDNMYISLNDNEQNNRYSKAVEKSNSEKFENTVHKLSLSGGDLLGDYNKTYSKKEDVDLLEKSSRMGMFAAISNNIEVNPDVVKTQTVDGFTEYDEIISKVKNNDDKIQVIEPNKNFDIIAEEPSKRKPRVKKERKSKTPSKKKPKKIKVKKIKAKVKKIKKVKIKKVNCKIIKDTKKSRFEKVVGRLDGVMIFSAAKLLIKGEKRVNIPKIIANRGVTYQKVGQIYRFLKANNLMTISRLNAFMKTVNKFNAKSTNKSDANVKIKSIVETNVSVIDNTIVENVIINDLIINPVISSVINPVVVPVVDIINKEETTLEPEIKIVSTENVKILDNLLIDDGCEVLSQDEKENYEKMFIDYD